MSWSWLVARGGGSVCGRTNERLRTEEKGRGRLGGEEGGPCGFLLRGWLWVRADGRSFEGKAASGEVAFVRRLVCVGWMVIGGVFG